MPPQGDTIIGIDPSPSDKAAGEPRLDLDHFAALHETALQDTVMQGGRRAAQVSVKLFAAYVEMVAVPESPAGNATAEHADALQQKAKVDMELARAKAKLAPLEQQLLQQQQALDKARHDLDLQKQNKTGLTKELNRLNGSVGSLENNIKTLSQDIADNQGQSQRLAQLQNQRDNAQNKLTEARRSAGRVEGQIAEAERQIRHYDQALNNTRQSHQTATQRVQSERSAVGKLNQDIAQAKTTMGNATQTIVGEQRWAENKAKTAEKTAAELQSQYRRAANKVQQTQANIKNLKPGQHGYQDMQSHLNKSKAQAQGLQKQLAAAQADADTYRKHAQRLAEQTRHMGMPSGSSSARPQSPILQPRRLKPLALPVVQRLLFLAGNPLVKIDLPAFQAITRISPPGTAALMVDFTQARLQAENDARAKGKPVTGRIDSILGITDDNYLKRFNGATDHSQSRRTPWSSTALEAMLHERVGTYLGLSRFLYAGKSVADWIDRLQNYVRMVEIDNQLAVEQARIGSASQMLNDSERLLREAEKRLHLEQTQLDDLTKHEDDLKQRIQQSQQRVDQLERHRANLDLRENDVTDDFRAYRNEIAKLKDLLEGVDIQARKAELADLKDRLQSWQSRIRVAGDMDDLNKLVKELEEKVNRALTRYNATAAEISSSRAAIDATQAQAESIARHIQNTHVPTWLQFRQAIGRHKLGTAFVVGLGGFEVYNLSVTQKRFLRQDKYFNKHALDFASAILDFAAYGGTVAELTRRAMFGGTNENITKEYRNVSNIIRTYQAQNPGMALARNSYQLANQIGVTARELSLYMTGKFVIWANRLNVVASIASAGVSSMYAWDSYHHADHDAGAAMAIAALGFVMQGAGSGLVLASFATALSSTALLAMTVLFWAGLILVLVGTVWYIYAKDDPIALLLAESPWGVNAYKGDDRSHRWFNKSGTLYNDLLDLFFRPRVQFRHEAILSLEGNDRELMLQVNIDFPFFHAGSDVEFNWRHQLVTKEAAQSDTRYMPLLDRDTFTLVNSTMLQTWQPDRYLTSTHVHSTALGMGRRIRFEFRLDKESFDRKHYFGLKLRYRPFGETGFGPEQTTLCLPTLTFDSVLGEFVEEKDGWIESYYELDPSPMGTLSID